MLGVDRVVGDGRVEPQPVTLVAVVEAGLHRGAGALAAPAAAPPAAALRPIAAVAVPSLALAVLVGVLIVGLGILVGLLGLVLLGGALAHRGLDLGLDLVAEVLLAGVVLGAELVPAAELPQLGGRDLELVGDPGVGAALGGPRRGSGSAVSAAALPSARESSEVTNRSRPCGKPATLRDRRNQWVRGSPGGGTSHLEWRRDARPDAQDESEHHDRR